jgi:hypothetical protein
VEREALQLLATATQEVGRLAAEVRESAFTSHSRRELFAAARDAFEHGVGSLGAKEVEVLSPETRSLLTELTVTSAPEPNEALAREIFTRLRVFDLEREIKVRRDTLQDVNPLDEPARHDALFTELVGLEAKRRDLLKGLQETA